MKVVLTGGAGFIGPHVAAALVAGQPEVQLTVVDNLATGDRQRLSGVPLAFYRRDVREPLDDLLAGVRVVVHLAGSAGVPPSVADPVADARANIEGTLALLESCRRCGVRRVVYASSAAVYGVPREVPIKETTPTLPTSPYGLSKLTGERYVLMYRDLFGLDTCALRLFNVYGPGQSPDSSYSGVITVFNHCLVHERPLPIEGNGKQVKDFVHVHDVARAIVQAVHAPTVSGVYNIASGVPTSILDLAHSIMRASGRQVPIELRPPRLGDVRESVADIGRATEAFGFRPELSLEEGLRQLWDQTIRPQP